MEPLADAVGLRAFHLGSGVVDILDRQVELIFVTIVGTAILCATIGQDPIDADRMVVEERDHPIVEDVGRGQWRLDQIELGEANLGIGVNHRLLIDPPDTLQRADIECILRKAIAWMLTVELTVSFFVQLGLLERHQLALSEHATLLRDLASSAFSRFFMVSRS